MVDIRLFGALVNGGDDTQAIQSAIDACPIGDTVLLPSGKIGFTSIRIDKPISLSGSGMASTFLVPLSDEDGICVNVGSMNTIHNVVLSNFTISPMQTRKSGAMVRLGNLNRGIIFGLKIDGSLGGLGYEGLRCDQVSNTSFTLLTVASCKSSGVVINPIGGRCSDISFATTCNIRSCGEWGIVVAGSDPLGTITVEGIHLYGTMIQNNALGGLLLDSSAGPIRNIRGHAATFDGNGTAAIEGHGVVARGAYTIENLMFNACWSTNNTGGYGYRFGSSVMDANVLSGNIHLNGLDGVLIEGSQRVRIAANDNWNNGQAAPGSYAIRITGPATAGVIANHIYNTYKDDYFPQRSVWIDKDADVFFSPGTNWIHL